MKATVTLLRSHFAMLKARYHGEEGTYVVQTSLSPFEPALPAITVTHSRRLFKDSMAQGVIACHTGNQPHFSINIASHHKFGLGSDPFDTNGEESHTKSGSWTGFGTGVREWSCGIALAGLETSLRAEWGLVFPELAAQASFALQLSLGGPGWVATGTWGDEHAGVTTMIGLNAAGVDLTLKYVSLFNFRDFGV
jgi:DnaJ family protein C protein 11